MSNYNYKYNENLRQKEIINSVIDLKFPSIIKKIKQTRHASYLIGYGEYPPQIRCFDLNNISLKFQRNLDCDVKDFQIISDNWEKLALLRSDKFIEFHSKSGYYYQVKIIKNSFSLLFNRESKILHIPSTHGDIFRFNLESGKFNCCIRNNLKFQNTSSAENFSNNILALGNSKGMIKIWDLRVIQKPVCTIDSMLYLKKNQKNIVTCLNFCKTSNYKFYAGFSSGEIILYDLRNLTPIISKNIGNELPIKTIKKNQQGNLILCADQKMVKIWNEINGKSLEYIKLKNQINHVCLLKNTGFIFISTNSPCLDSRYIPLLGPVPNWCFPFNYHKREKFFSKKKSFINLKKNSDIDNKISISINKLAKFK